MTINNRSNKENRPIYLTPAAKIDSLDESLAEDLVLSS
jgi:hypothetical protein